jgi:hypothetical protein
LTSELWSVVQTLIRMKMKMRKIKLTDLVSTSC